MMHKLPAQKEQLIAAQEEEGSISSMGSVDSDPRKVPPLPPTRARGSASLNSTSDDLSSIKQQLGLN